jgi:hypothetical protein
MYRSDRRQLIVMLIGCASALTMTWLLYRSGRRADEAFGILLGHGFAVAVYVSLAREKLRCPACRSRWRNAALKPRCGTCGIGFGMSKAAFDESKKIAAGARTPDA